MQVYGVIGWKNSGKTGLMERLIAELRGRGLRVSSIKHAHHSFDIDQPGKDSYKLRKAGACEMMVASTKRWALVHESPERRKKHSLEELLPHLSLKDLDLVLVEGFKHEPLAKIELHRPSLGKPFLFPNVSGVVAIATDEPPVEKIKLPVLDLNKIDEIAEFIMKRFLKK